MRVIICGGREYRDEKFLRAFLDRFHQSTMGPITTLIEGGARGADRLARDWAYDKGIRCYTVWAPWKVLENAAGPTRNGWMLELEPDAVIAFPGGSGTANMIQQARNAGVTVHTARKNHDDA